MKELYTTNTITNYTLNQIIGSNTITEDYGSDDVASPTIESENQSVGSHLIDATIIRPNITGGTFRSSRSGARIDIFPTYNYYTGMVAYDDDAHEVFKITIGGDNVGDVQIGDYDAGQGILYDKSQNRTIFSGELIAKTGTIGGFTISETALYGAGTIYGGTIKTGATVAEGSNGVIMDTDGLRGYDSVLGKVFDLPTDGSAPSFTSGVISNTVFEINTNAVLRTADTVGDGTSASAGVLINNTGFYGCVANQLLADANVRILTEGTLFAGTTDNYIDWDGTNLKIKGALILTSPFSNLQFTVDNPPYTAETAGFNNPTTVT